MTAAMLRMTSLICDGYVADGIRADRKVRI